MTDDAPQDIAPTPWPIEERDGRRVVAFASADISNARAAVSMVEALLLHALDFNRKGDAARAAKAIQSARSTLARWGGELAELEERLARR